MQREEFDLRVRMLLPGIRGRTGVLTPCLAEDPEVEETMDVPLFMILLYVDLALVKRDHGEIVATDLLNYATSIPSTRSSSEGRQTECGWMGDSRNCKSSDRARRRGTFL